LPTTTDYHSFREGIMPTWEDPSKRQVSGSSDCRARLASRYWRRLSRR
jgi:hypothetical protein